MIFRRRPEVIAEELFGQSIAVPLPPGLAMGAGLMVLVAGRRVDGGAGRDGAVTVGH